MITGTQRLAWIDWMKTIAMYSIVAGHGGVPGNKNFYVFSVPCFFILSGFLSKQENDASVMGVGTLVILGLLAIIILTLNKRISSDITLHAC